MPASTVCQAVAGRGLRALLRLDSGEALQAVFHKQLQPSHIRSACDNKLDALWSPVLQGQLAALVQVHEGQHEAAFAEYAKVRSASTSHSLHPLGDHAGLAMRQMNTTTFIMTCSMKSGGCKWQAVDLYLHSLLLFQR